MVKSRRSRKLVLQRNLRILRSLTHSKSVDLPSIFSDAVKYIQELKSKIEALQTDSLHNTEAAQQAPIVVKVEKYERGMCAVRVMCCEKVKGLLLCVLEGLEALGVEVVYARVFCKDSFCMEAYGKVLDRERDRSSGVVDGEVMRETLTKALILKANEIVRC
ncbi:uncharacterized protein LOC116261367 [Nymphaea colorata]|nr:uncharacterized protein LOC116261367 [Nymphaea colorata]